MNEEKDFTSLHFLVILYNSLYKIEKKIYFLCRVVGYVLECWKMPKSDAATSETNSVLDELEVVDHLKDHVTQSVLEANCIDAIERQTEEKRLSLAYPLDGRNLELTKLMHKKKRRLEKSVKRANGAKKIRTSDETKTETSSSNLLTIVSEIPNSSPGTKILIKTELWEKLYDFQRIGVKFLLSKFLQNTGCLLADEMGLGKSFQAIAFVSAIFSSFNRIAPILIVCPTTLVDHWREEFSKWDSEIVCVDLSSSTSFQPKPKTVYLISYETFRARFDALEISKHQFSVAILDEAQRVRNPDAKTTIAVKRINCTCRIALSGSPIQNNLTELWSIFDFVAPGRLGTLPTFQEELATPIEQGTKPRASFTDTQLSLKCALIVRELTAPLMLRRLKRDFAEELELANKEEQVLFCQLSAEQLEVYCQFLSTETVRTVVQSDKLGHEKGKFFYALSVLRRIANHPDLLLSDWKDVDDFGNAERSGKLQVLIPLLELWHRQNRRCLVFSQSLGMLDILEQTLRNLNMTFLRMDGSTNTSRRAEIVALFDGNRKTVIAQNNAPFCLLLSTRVGGVGLNLTGADRVVIFDPDWNPMTDTQARERSWRIGQKKDVKIFRLIAAETIEEVICKRQIYKHYLAQKILTDPRQTKLHDWDHLEDMFKAPSTSLGAESKASSSRSRALEKIFGSFKKIEEEAAAESKEVSTESFAENEQEAIQGLVETILNHEKFEMPKLSPALVDYSLVESASARAVEAIMAEQKTRENLHITVPTWTGKQGASGSALDRSKSLLGKIGSAGTKLSPTNVHVRYESTEHVIEKSIVKSLRKFFLAKNFYTASTDEVMKKFADKIPDGGDVIFRNCLRSLCDFEPTNSQWTLKRQHI